MINFNLFHRLDVMVLFAIGALSRSLLSMRTQLFYTKDTVRRCRGGQYRKLWSTRRKKIAHMKFMEYVCCGLFSVAILFNSFEWRCRRWWVCCRLNLCVLFSFSFLPYFCLSPPFCSFELECVFVEEKKFCLFCGGSFFFLVFARL